MSNMYFDIFKIVFFVVLCFVFIAAEPIRNIDEPMEVDFDWPDIKPSFAHQPKITNIDEPMDVDFEWTDIRPINIFVDPIGPVPQIPVQRVVGGEVAPRNAFPYQAALIINTAGFCGGSIISDQWVLTAAHCVDTATSVQIIAGAHNPFTTVNEPLQVRIAAQAITVHAQWSPSTIANDIALLRAANIPIQNEGIAAIALAPSNSGSFAGSTGVLTGWGMTSDSSNSVSTQLMTVQLPIITNAVCQQYFGIWARDEHICTSGAGGRGGCFGDSGGPLVVNGVEVGIVSFGSSLCEGGEPTAYARVSYFRDWIQTNSGV